jgi:hypothetical protein
MTISQSDLQMCAGHAGFLLEQDNSSGHYVITPGEKYDLNEMLAKVAALIERKVRNDTAIKAAQICNNYCVETGDIAHKCAKEIQEFAKKQK